jgi:hypothetical protein
MAVSASDQIQAFQSKDLAQMSAKIEKGQFLVDPEGGIGMFCGYKHGEYRLQYGTDGPFKRWAKDAKLRHATDAEIVEAELNGVGHTPPPPTPPKVRVQPQAPAPQTVAEHAVAGAATLAPPRAVAHTRIVLSGGAHGLAAVADAPALADMAPFSLTSTLLATSRFGDPTFVWDSVVVFRTPSGGEITMRTDRLYEVFADRLMGEMRSGLRRS